MLKSSLQALTKMGITAPTPIQAQTIRPLMEGHDVIAQACTGSGKTLAFCLPLMQYVDPAKSFVQALILVPTRELATQVASILEDLGHADHIRTTVLVGGRSLGPQESSIRRGAHIVVGAPGRVLDMINRGVLKLDKVAFLVLDEADEMLDRGFMHDVKQILSHAPAPSKRLTALFSATQPDWVDRSSAQFLHQPVRVKIETTEAMKPKIEHVAQEIAEGARYDMLRKLLDERDGSGIVFARTKHGVKKLAKQLAACGYPVDALQGNMSQNARDRVVDQFRKGGIEILVATNVAARGLDLEGVTLIVNYELPETAELLTHRVGRTGRMGKAGTAVTLVAPSDRSHWADLERTLGHRLPRRPMPPEASLRRGPNTAAPFISPCAAPIAPVRVPGSQGARRPGGGNPRGASNGSGRSSSMETPRRPGSPSRGRSDARR